MDTFELVNIPGNFIAVDTIANKSEVVAVENSIPGAYILAIPCYHRLIQEKNNETIILVKERFPCPKAASNKIVIERAIPLLWTNLKSLHIDFEYHQPNSYFDEDNMYNKSWTTEVPHFNVKTDAETLKNRLQKLYITFLKFDNKHFSYLQMMICGMLSVHTIAIAIILYILIQRNCRGIPVSTERGEKGRGRKHVFEKPRKNCKEEQ